MHASVTKQLIAPRCDIDAQKKSGATALYVAAQKGHVSVTDQLIDARCNMDLMSDTALHHDPKWTCWRHEGAHSSPM